MSKGSNKIHPSAEKICDHMDYLIATGVSFTYQDLAKLAPSVNPLIIREWLFKVYLAQDMQGYLPSICIKDRMIYVIYVPGPTWQPTHISWYKRVSKTMHHVWRKFAHEYL